MYLCALCFYTVRSRQMCVLLLVMALFVTVCPCLNEVYVISGACVLVAKRAYYFRHVCPSVCPHVSARPHRTNFREIYYWGLLRKSVEKLHFFSVGKDCPALPMKNKVLL
jgi:hypothetical protein